MRVTPEIQVFFIFQALKSPEKLDIGLEKVPILVSCGPETRIVD